MDLWKAPMESTIATTSTGYNGGSDEEICFENMESSTTPAESLIETGYNEDNQGESRFFCDLIDKFASFITHILVSFI